MHSSCFGPGRPQGVLGSESRHRSPHGLVTLEGPSRHEMSKRRMLSGVPAGGPGSGSASACSGGGELPSSSLSPLLFWGLRSCFCGCSLADLPPGPGTHVLIRCHHRGVGPCPVSESESLLVVLLLELDSSAGAAAAAGCSLRSGFGGGGLTPGGTPSCEAGSLLARSSPFAWRTAFGGLDLLRM